jgi:hypothetical protein
MKAIKLIFLTFFMGLLFMSCEKDSTLISLETDEAIETRAKSEVEIPFKGKFFSFPVAMDLIDCGYELGLPIYNAISGNATHLGELDPFQSPLIGVDCSFNPGTMIVTATIDMTFKNLEGDGLRILGQSDMSLNGPASGSYVVQEGFGKLYGATGNLNTTGKLNPNDGTAEFEVDGKIVVPK